MKFLLILFMAATIGCGGSGGSNQSQVTAPNPSPETVPASLFGVNMPWENLSDSCVTRGELIRDRSFRINSSGFSDPAGNSVSPPWTVYNSDANGSVSFSAVGGDVPAGAHYYPGYAIVTRTALGDSGVYQTLLESVANGTAYTLSYSSAGVTQGEVVAAYLYDASAPGVPISNAAYLPSGNGVWSRQSVVLTATADAVTAGLIIVLHHDGTGSTRTVYLDEIRLSPTSASPAVKPSVKTAMQSAGIKSIRWPGGTLVDFFTWKDSIGALMARGEVRASSSYQTPSFGLHECLNLCEELGAEPVIQVNFLSDASNAPDLIEYILGNASTPMGAIRAANGRTQPWNVSTFAIGNEPATSYKGAGTADHAGLAYSANSASLISAIKSKASALGKAIKVNGIIEPTFQLADWLPAAAATPGTAYDPIRMISNWNADVLGPSGIGPIDYLDGHFYGYKKFDPAMSEAQAFTYVMASGALLEKTLEDKIHPLSTAPIWITEYNIFPQEDVTNLVHTERMMDFQSGLAIGDMLISMIRFKISGAHMWNLAQPWFGMLQNPDTGRLRPAGLVFSLFAPMAGEVRLNVSADNSETVNVGTGSGTVPTGLTYPLVSVIASKNASTGRPRIICINRSYASSKTVTLTFDTPVPGNATVYAYESLTLSANNETAAGVSIASSSAHFSGPISVTLAPHSIKRIDMQ